MIGISLDISFDDPGKLAVCDITAAVYCSDRSLPIQNRISNSNAPPVMYSYCVSTDSTPNSNDGIFDPECAASGRDTFRRVVQQVFDGDVLQQPAVDTVVIDDLDCR